MENKGELVKHLVDSGVLETSEIIAAFQKFDRADFVQKEYLDEAYEDHPLPIGHGQTISQPSTVAFMLELLQPKAGEKILDVGSGSGWTTALLAQIVGPSGKVFGVELIPALADFGRKNLEKYNFSWAEIRSAGEKVGLAEEAPFDKILVSASGEEIPQELISQLKIGPPASPEKRGGQGGRMVIPVQNSVWKIDKLTKSEVRKEEFPGFVFVPLK